MASPTIERAIEVAEHNGWWRGKTLIVSDGLIRDPNYGIRLEVFPAAPAIGGFGALARDGVGNSHVVYRSDRAEAAEDALLGYLELRNR